jgi:hypothetical protein
MDKHRFASLTLAYNQKDYLEYRLRQLMPECGAVFVMYSEVPFTLYNPNARAEFSRVDGSREILCRLNREFDHLYVIEGEWTCEDDMRNAGLEAALTKGFESLLIIDADEFYHEQTLPILRQFMRDHPDTDSWWCRVRVPFKYIDYVIDRDDEFLPVAIRLGGATRFCNRRVPSGRRQRLDDRFLLFNMGFVLSDARMLEKTRTYSHAHQLPPLWYQEKWLGWTPETRNLHTRVPALWPRTRFQAPTELPAILRGHPLACRWGTSQCAS